METEFQKLDGNGAELYVARTKRANGEILEFPAHDAIKTSSFTRLLDNWAEFVQRDDDVWLFGYPRSGTHWCYEIIQQLLHGKAGPTANFKAESMVEIIRFDTIQELNDAPSPRVYDVHSRMKYFMGSTRKLKGKVIAIARNPKSVAISNYFLHAALKSARYEGTFHGYLPIFLSGLYNSRGSWFEWMSDWMTFSQNPDNSAHLLFYEDLKENPQEEIRKLADFLSVAVTDEFVNDVIDAASFEKMQAGVGKTQQTKVLYKSVAKDTTKPMFFRKGVIDDWKNYFTVAQNEMFDAIYEEKMKVWPELKNKIRFQ